MREWEFEYMKDKKPLKIAVIGCGLIANARHLPTYKRIKNVEVCAVCDVNETIAKKTATDFGISNVYADVSKMLSVEEPDIIDICVPPQVHTSVALEAIENNCNVIMEKPMALKTSDCDLMLNAARKKGVKLCVNHNYLFYHPFIEAKKLIADGAIGDFVGMRIFLSTPKPDMIDLKDHWYHKLPGGVIGETGPHVTYMSQAFLKNIHNVDIYAKKFLDHPWAPFDEFRLEYEGDNGFSSVILSYMRNCWTANVEIFGTEAELHLDFNNMLVIRHQLKELSYMPLARSSMSTISQIMGGTASNVFNVITGKQKVGTDVIIERFVDSILNDTPLPVTGDDGRETVRVMEMIVNGYHEKYGA